MRDRFRRNEKSESSRNRGSGRKIKFKQQQEMKKERLERVRRKNRMEELSLAEEWE